MKDLVSAVLMVVIMTVGLGLAYPLAVTGVSRLLFPHQANGSLIERDGVVIGSELIGQHFTSAKYFHGRPSAAGNGYDAAASSGSNLGPTSEKLINRIKADAETRSTENPGVPVPADLLTTSASGLDPHISPAAAEFQIARVAADRGVDEAKVRELVAKFTEARTFGLLGEPRVNVLRLNLALDAELPAS
ncbi:MAG: potassium-transporting ATPase subunit KdpC [Pyrinomonadaceae bacterium]